MPVTGHCTHSAVKKVFNIYRRQKNIQRLKEIFMQDIIFGALIYDQMTRQLKRTWALHAEKVNSHIKANRGWSNNSRMVFISA